MWEHRAAASGGPISRSPHPRFSPSVCLFAGSSLSWAGVSDSGYGYRFVLSQTAELFVPAMGLSRAFLGVLFLSGTLGKGRLGNPQGAEGWDRGLCKG